MSSYMKFSGVVPLIGLVAFNAYSETVTQNEHPNIVIIFADDLGYGDLGCFGAKDPPIQTPNIDRMAEEGIKFTNFISACNTSAPSRAALLTGRYPNRCGLPIGMNPHRGGENVHANIGLQQSEITIAEILKPLGYKTAMFGKSHLGVDMKFYPLRHGFDEYYGSLFNFPVGGTCPVLEGDSVIQPEMRYQDIHRKLTERTIDFMKRSMEEDKPFFIYLSHYLVHGPWDINREFATDEEWDIYQNQPIRGQLQHGGRKLYPAMVRELDWNVGEVVKAIKELGLDENTLVLFTSDNGPDAGTAGPLRGSKYNTFEGGHRVPSIAWWPEKIPAGQVSDALCSTMDYFPTIAHLAGAGLPKDRKIDGVNIWPIMKGDENAKAHEILYYYNGTMLEAVREGNWKLHLPRQLENKVYWSKGRFGGFNNLESPVLFNLDRDIEEKRDVANEHPDIVNRLLDIADKAREELGDWNIKGKDQKNLLNYSGNVNNPVWEIKKIISHEND